MHDHNHYQVTKSTTIVNACANFILSLLKVILGFFGHSHALLADGIHSFSDLLTDAFVFFAAKIGMQRPDQEHPYGHRRVETVSTIVVALILASIAIGIAVDAVHHMFSGKLQPKPELIVIIVAILSVITNEFLYQYTLLKSNKINSELLRSSAWHKRSDAMVSLIVIVSVLGAMFGAQYLDAIGAIIIAILIFYMAIKMIWRSIEELIDTGVENQVFQQISSAICKIPGVISLHELRSRSHGGHIFLDGHIQVPPKVSISEGHYISEQVIIQLKQQFPQIVDMVIHIDPENDEEFHRSRNLPNRQQIEKQLAMHCQAQPSYAQLQKMVLHYLQGELSIELYFPLALQDSGLEQFYTQALQKIPAIHHIQIYYAKG